MSSPNEAVVAGQRVSIFTSLVLMVLWVPNVTRGITYEYDALNRLAKAGYEDGTVILYDYDAVGNRTAVLVTQSAPVYRFWSARKSRYFYTINKQERQKLVDEYAHVWTYEGVAFGAFTEAGRPGVVPVYRFWSDTLSSHFYTIREPEKTKLVDNPDYGWTYEGVAFYVYPTNPAPPRGTSPVYRFWSDSLHTHFYTIHEREKTKLIDSPNGDWILEGIAWYAYAL